MLSYRDKNEVKEKREKKEGRTTMSIHVHPCKPIKHHNPSISTKKYTPSFLVQNSKKSPLTLPLKPPPLPLGSSNCLLSKKFSRGLKLVLDLIRNRMAKGKRRA
jgi:hypothetical protein